MLHDQLNVLRITLHAQAKSTSRSGSDLSRMPLEPRYLDGSAQPVPRNTTSLSSPAAAMRRRHCGTAASAEAPPAVTSRFGSCDWRPLCRGRGRRSLSCAVLSARISVSSGPRLHCAHLLGSASSALLRGAARHLLCSSVRGLNAGAACVPSANALPPGCCLPQHLACDVFA